MSTTSTDRSGRRRVLRTAGGIAASLLPLAGFTHGGAVPRIEIWRDAGCACCEQWIRHLQGYFFVPEVHDAVDGAAVRRRLGMPESLAACHTARIEDYVIEGHVPGTDIHRLLADRPSALGLAVPGMPAGSPGMETSGPKDSYEVLLVARDGSTSVFKSYR